MAIVTFVNHSNISFIGYLGLGNSGTPAATPTIAPGEAKSLTFPGGDWALTVQSSDSPPLQQNSPQVNIIARTNIAPHNNDAYSAKFTKDQQLVASKT